MTGTFLEDLTRAGNAIWELYLSPFDGASAQDPPAFPAWQTIPEAEDFAATYGNDYDWRVWMGWTTAFSFMATVVAMADDMPASFDTLDKFVELMAIHMGQRCPGHHLAHGKSTMNVLRALPEYQAPTWHYGSGDLVKFRFEVAAHQEWLIAQGALFPERALTSERSEEVVALATDIENDLFKTAELGTLIGLMTLSMHLATKGMANLTTTQEDAVRRFLCVYAHSASDTVKTAMRDNASRHLLEGIFDGAIFRQDRLN